MQVNTGIPQFTLLITIYKTLLLMWGHIKKHGMQKPRKSRLLSSTNGEKNRVEL